MGKRVILKIRGHLQATGFLHRPEIHTFHLLCGECTITLEDVVLQLSLPMDGSIIMGSRIVSNKVTLCQSLLEKVPDKFESGRISMNWLKDNFDELPKDRTNELGISHTVHVIPGDVLGHKPKVGVDRWLSAPAAVVGLVAITVYTSQGD
ncbi:hypothetical protein Godav_004064 [Gossypium davidsonii]|uniref:Aminotransferase-like plant mobile domain-containing protein n=1 Tax=Gossypium davidsonii TaxID=34287 RepID=A0A7J8SKQ1_GOSDV|nr:hypothetical protein [Gossypium davidsonii]